MSVQGTVAVLTYHSIAVETTEAFAPLTVDPALFDEHLTALREHCVEVIPFCEVPGALAAGATAVAITIDDGLADAAETACPILARHGLPATLFVPTACIGGSSSWLRGADARRRMCSWQTIAELSQSGFEIGSHGHLHLAADVNSLDLVRRDAQVSQIALADHLGRTASSFAYPFGYHSRQARAAVRAAGFAQACAVGDLPAEAGDDRWALPRLQVFSHTSPEALLDLVTRRPARAGRCWAHAKQTVFRFGRRWAGWGPIEAGRLQGAFR